MIKWVLHPFQIFSYPLICVCGAFKISQYSYYLYTTQMFSWKTLTSGPKCDTDWNEWARKLRVFESSSSSFSKHVISKYSKTTLLSHPSRSASCVPSAWIPSIHCIVTVELRFIRLAAKFAKQRTLNPRSSCYSCLKFRWGPFAIDAQPNCIGLLVSWLASFP